MKKRCARWVQRLLTIDQKCMRTDISQPCLSLIALNPRYFWRSFVTVDETWIHRYIPESKQQSKQWTGPGERASKKAKTVVSPEKELTTEELRAKRPRLAQKKGSSCQIARFRFPIGSSSILFPRCDFFIFPNLEKWLGGRTSNEEVIDDVNGYFEDLETSNFSEGIKNRNIAGPRIFQYFDVACRQSFFQESNARDTMPCNTRGCVEIVINWAVPQSRILQE
ncbi:hypothetical protein LAZ67_10001974 [Cordylochernes scorpioides]|uniref:Transposase n=1 Tax=Cordylochernes scorpioides TaxID=51811 RepID=A0ABY6KW98_9ARAC|nr:hypothetical protein LAZ67_10001974 [Cordylochernes scorpioides]